MKYIFLLLLFLIIAMPTILKILDFGLVQIMQDLQLNQMNQLNTKYLNLMIQTD